LQGVSPLTFLLRPLTLSLHHTILPAARKRIMNRAFLLSVVILLPSAGLAAEPDATRVLERGKHPADHRLGSPKTLNDYFPFTPPTSKQAWETRRQAVREQMLVALGLWPMPEKQPLQPMIHGKIDRDDYTIEKVFFASYPGHYVSGNLYRPKGKTGKVPGVLCPHGHWQNGRFYEANDKQIEQDLKSGAEKTAESARYPLQARCAMLARLGCVVFHYDMVGVADSQPIPHREGFKDAEALLRLQSFMGLQSFNSIRALDFLVSLPDVDPQRIGVTGASGGGTQTFTLCGIDDRPTVSFPAVMVSTAMQGGCVCENAPYLRQGTGNVEFAALFAPKPLGMSAAEDWTKEIETKGLPQLKELYRLYGAEDHVMAHAFLQFGHNYNQVSRELMYNWFNKHLQLGHTEPIAEKPFVPVPPKELSVYDAQHPRPADASDAAVLRKVMTAISEKQLTALKPADSERLTQFRTVVGTALRVMIGDQLPEPAAVEQQKIGADEEHDGVHWHKSLIGRKSQGEKVPVIELRGREFDGTVVIWIHPAGKGSLVKDGSLTPAARTILDHNAAIVAPDVFQAGELVGGTEPAVDPAYAGFTFGYNRPLLANRVHDILTTVAYAKAIKGVHRIDLVGMDRAGPWVLLARALCGDAVRRTAADASQFDFTSVHANADPMMLPGTLKYGGLPAFAALCAPGELFVHNQPPSNSKEWLAAAYAAANAVDRLTESTEKAPEKAVEWLLR
jgi:dienelactone hydrolase